MPAFQPLVSALSNQILDRSGGRFISPPHPHLIILDYKRGREKEIR